MREDLFFFDTWSDYWLSYFKKISRIKEPKWIRGDGVSNISSISPIISILALKHNSTRHKCEQSLGDSGGQWSLACCSPWCLRESDRTRGLNKSNDILVHKMDGWGLNTLCTENKSFQMQQWAPCSFSTHILFTAVCIKFQLYFLKTKFIFRINNLKSHPHPASNWSFVSFYKVIHFSLSFEILTWRETELLGFKY